MITSIGFSHLLEQTATDGSAARENEIKATDAQLRGVANNSLELQQIRSASDQFRTFSHRGTKGVAQEAPGGQELPRSTPTKPLNGRGYQGFFAVQQPSGAGAVRHFCNHAFDWAPKTWKIF
jgi:hypothetical protein